MFDAFRATADENAVNPVRALATGLSVLLLATGCARSMALSAEITRQRDSWPALGTLHDFEIGRAAYTARLGDLERLHYLDAEDDDLLLMLSASWSNVTYAFTEDDYERALDQGDPALADYHLKRARAGYERAIYYVTELLEHRDAEFARVRSNPAALGSWLNDEFSTADDAPLLVAAAAPWLNLAALPGEWPKRVGSVEVGPLLAARALELDETAAFGLGHVLLGAYEAALAAPKLESAKQHLSRALELEDKKYLPTFVELALVDCKNRDVAGYERNLNEVLRATDPLPVLRFDNVVAKRRAQRYLAGERWRKACDG
jgi:hypothetical protein